ncbi:MAG: glutathione ABC transporter substrate-binding protein GsiB [Bordetella sp.]|uniref:glutathione ABC transporter substrate-binding protein GsiB n=1 Tax=Bordetella sp. TaxID=28081 RepID=UPI003F7C88ED
MNTRFDPLSKRKALATCLLAFASLTAAGSAWAAKDAVLAINAEPDSLDPYNTNSTLAMAVTKTFYEGLFKFDKDLKIVPVLAESYTVSPDGLVYTFKLRQGVKFQDGTDFNADAVKANIDRVLDQNNHLTRYAQFNRIAKVEAVDPYTVRFTLKEPFAPFLNSLAHPSAAMISPTALKKWGKDIALHPVGTGPFTFVEWKHADDIKGAKFGGYWHKGYPKVDAVTWKPVPENSTRAAMLQTGETDFAYPLPYEQAASLSKSDKLNVITRNSIIERYISMNVQHKPFDNVKVRQAVAYAINRQALAKVAFSGYAIPAEGIVPQGVAYAYKMQPWPYDPKKAKELLKEAGYPNGFEATLWGAYNDTTTLKALQFLQQQLAQVGIKVKVRGLEPAERTDLIQNQKDPAAAPVRMYYSGWSASTGEADWALRPLLTKEAFPPVLYNTAYYTNPIVEKDVAGALKSVDEKQKTDMYKEAQQQVWNDAPWATLTTDKLISGTSKRLSGVYVMPDGNIDISDIAIK